MHRYLLSVQRYFSGEETFTVEAADKTTAVEIGESMVARDPHFTGGNYKRGSVRCVKKLKNN